VALVARDNIVSRSDSPAWSFFMLYPTSLPEHYAPETDILSGKKIVLTGGATDLGHAVAISCAHHGAELILIERKERLVNNLYDEIVSIGAPEPLTVAFSL